MELMYVFFFISIFYNIVRLVVYHDSFGKGEISVQSLMNYTSSLCFTGLISLAVFLVLLYALKQFYDGHDRFSEDHESNIALSSIIFVIGFLTGLFVVQIQVIAYAVASFLLVKELADELEKRLLISSVGLNVMYGITSYIFLRFIVKREISNSLSYYSISWLAIVVTVGYLLFMVTYRRIERRLEGSDDEDEDIKELQRCPKCGEKTLEVSAEGTVECRNCDYPNVSFEGDFSYE